MILANSILEYNFEVNSMFCNVNMSLQKSDISANYMLLQILS